ncbi:MAG: hypothetical protein ABW166_08145 [Sedimenticola sp.]
MLQNIKDSILYLSLLPLFIISLNASAVTICALNCQGSGDGGSSEPPLPQIIEFKSPDGGSLVLDIDGLIFLDISIFNKLSGLTISTTTPIYNGLSDLSSDIILPEQFELNIIDLSGGGFSLTGGSIEYSLLRNFQNNSLIDLSTPDGIIVMDTNSLFAVPLPASSLLLFSGIVAFFSFGIRKNAVT